MQWLRPGIVPVFRTLTVIQPLSLGPWRRGNSGNLLTDFQLTCLCLRQPKALQKLHQDKSNSKEKTLSRISPQASTDNQADIQCPKPLSGPGRAETSIAGGHPRRGSGYVHEFRGFIGDFLDALETTTATKRHKISCTLRSDC